MVSIGRIVVPFVTIVLKICMVFPVRYLARRVAWWKASGHSGPCFAADSHEFVRAGFCADCNFGKSLLGDRANRSRAPSICYVRLTWRSRRKGRCNIWRQRLSQSVPHARSWQAHLRRRQHHSATNSANDRLAVQCELRGRCFAAPIRSE